MSLFKITFEDVGFGCEPGDCGEMDETTALSFTKARRAGTERLFPEGVLAVLGASYSVDDSVYEDGEDEEGDVKAFVTVRLLVEAEDGEAAALIDAPTDLLNAVAAHLAEDQLEMEGNWENTDCAPYLEAD